MRSFSAAARAVPELAELFEVLRLFGDRATAQVITTVHHSGIEFPILSVVVGSRRPEAPTLALIGGVHGLERIGARVVLAGMHTFAQFLTWDRILHAALEDARLVCLPLVNPVGMWLRRRSNGNCVDLMRNAPVQVGTRGTPLIGGQGLSRRLPWYFGDPENMEVEARALCTFVREWVFPARASIALDVHSGFGSIDRIWFPYAHSCRPFPAIAEAYALKSLLDDTLPNHVYAMEPVAQSYRVRGDLWDLLFDEHQARGHAQDSCPGPGSTPGPQSDSGPGGPLGKVALQSPTGAPFLPLTLELGSWLWIRKNPRQIFDLLGGFNPIRPHRLRRTLRRHLPLIQFLLRAVAGSDSWSRFGDRQRRQLESEALRLWFS